MNPWKVTAIAMGVAMATALVTGLVVANWTGGDRAAQEQNAQQKVAQATPARGASMPGAPSQSAIAACNKYAASEAGSKDKTMEVVKDGAIGGVVGASGGSLYGLNENKKHDERYRAAYASCMRARGFTA